MKKHPLMRPAEYYEKKFPLLNKELEEDFHAFMNGPRIAQSLPKEYLEALLKVTKYRR
jgi:hypothetical protein